MRIGNKVVQLVGERLVVVNDEDRAEMPFTLAEVDDLVKAINYFRAHMAEVTNGEVEKVTAEMSWEQFTEVHEVLAKFVQGAPNTPEFVGAKTAITSIRYTFHKK